MFSFFDGRPGSLAGRGSTGEFVQMCSTHLKNHETLCFHFLTVGRDLGSAGEVPVGLNNALLFTERPGSQQVIAHRHGQLCIDTPVYCIRDVSVHSGQHVIANQHISARTALHGSADRIGHCHGCRLFCSEVYIALLYQLCLCTSDEVEWFRFLTEPQEKPMQPPNNIIFHTFTSPEPPKHTSRSSLHGRHGPARVASTVQLVRRIRWMCPGATTDALHPARSTIASPGTWQRCAWFELGGPVQTGVDE